jgi:hypothetical protein
MIEMYRVAMEQVARDDIAAATAAHRELGRDYDGAIAEGLIERIGAEIDKRVDARLAQRADDRPAQSGDKLVHRGDKLVHRGSDGRPSSTAGPGAAGVLLGLGSMGIGIGAAAVVLAESRSSVGLVILIWIVIGVINVAYARRR